MLDKHWIWKFSASFLERFDLMVNHINISFFPIDLQSEIRSRIQSKRESIEDELLNYGSISENDLPSSADSLIYDIINSIYDDSLYSNKWKKAIRLYWIKNGAYREITKEEMNNVFVTTGKKYDFKMDGKFYVFNHHPF